MKWFKNLTTMKKWGVISWATVIILTITLIVLTCTHSSDMDLSYLSQITMAGWGELAVYNGCYCYKEKAANKQKIAYDFINKLADKYGFEAVSSLVQSVISE